MARIRSIKPTFWLDEKLGPLEPIDRLVYIGLWSMADDAGRLADNLKAIDAFIFPYTEDSSVRSLERLAERERIIRYITAGGMRVIQIARWAEHQRIDRPSPSGYPAPEGYRAPRRSRSGARAAPPAPTSVLQATREALLGRDEGKCSACGSTRRLQIDHIVPVSQGGTHELGNLRLLCIYCNARKGGRLVEPSTNSQELIHEASTNDSRGPRGVLAAGSGSGSGSGGGGGSGSGILKPEKLMPSDELLGMYAEWREQVQPRLPPDPPPAYVRDLNAFRGYVLKHHADYGTPAAVFHGIVSEVTSSEFWAGEGRKYRHWKGVFGRMTEDKLEKRISEAFASERSPPEAGGGRSLNPFRLENYDASQPPEEQS